ncbi:hypothetical protein N0V90_004512 [Kalmusia sp. IMI 367209]|nr:hypothetical protein N0V90_004512 [Kalmusia sp. IMI 367209]
MAGKGHIKSVAVVGAGAAGSVLAIYDAEPTNLPLYPGHLPPDTDPPLEIPEALPQITPPSQQHRWTQTPIYQSLTTNVPAIAMSFSDSPFAYGPFAPHYIPRQYVENYFSIHKTDAFLQLNTTVEDITKLPSVSDENFERWKLTLRKHDPIRNVDAWWEEEFDAVILANGHYSVPIVPQVKGLDAYIAKFPGRVSHSKQYRSPLIYAGKKVLVIGNSASGHDVSVDLVGVAQAPIYQSRRSKARWDGDAPLPGVEWKPVIKEYLPSGRIVFEDDTHLDDVDHVFYCTGNGRPLWDYEANKLIKTYWHTFFHDYKTLAIVGMPRTLTFRSFEYQAIALARLFSGRNAAPLPPMKEQVRWEAERAERTKKEGKKFHDVPWEGGETVQYLDKFFQIAGLNTIRGEGLVPPVLGKDLIWAIEHLRKYPEDPGEHIGKPGDGERDAHEGGWVVVDRPGLPLGGVLP